MTTTTDFKPGIDHPVWFQCAPTPVTDASALSVAWDMRNGTQRLPYNYYLTATTGFYAYNIRTDGFLQLPSPALVGSAAGTSIICHPSQGPRGTIYFGSTTTSIILSTALPAAIGANQLTNKGDGIGFTIRIYDNAAGGTGKTEEAVIIANTSGTTPIITVSPAFSFTPLSGDTYEILSGRIFLLGSGTTGTSTWKYYDVATNSMSSGLGTTSLPATIATDSAMVALSESYVSSDRAPGWGFMDTGSTYNQSNFYACSCTAVSGTTITAGALVNPSTPSLFANEYANFQIRIVYDSATPTSVGQRRTIASHTSGNTPVFTVSSAWTTNPSTSALFVVENQDNLILLRSSATTSVYAYSISGNTWSTSTFTAAGSANGAGNVFEQCFGTVRDPTGNRRHSHCFFIRGGNVSSIDLLDIAANAWTAAITYGSSTSTFTTGTSGAYDGVTNGGKYLYLNLNGTTANLRLDLFAAVLKPYSNSHFPAGTAVLGQRLSMGYFIDGTTVLATLYHWVSSTNSLSSTLLGF